MGTRNEQVMSTCIYSPVTHITALALRLKNAYAKRQNFSSLFASACYRNGVNETVNARGP